MRQLAVVMCGVCFLGACANDQAPTVEAPSQVRPGQASAETGGSPTPKQVAAEHGSFGSYWYQGLAEMNRYKLSQSRYGELHEGEAVLIYVTENFLTDKQLKHEFGPADKAVPILKLNASRRFYTGVYPYTILTSVFKPTTPSSSPALKVVNSVQEWCGVTYTQLNRGEEKWKVAQHSYFQAEGDEELSLAGALTEDEMWVQVRRDPTKLPVGEMQMVPGIHYLRFVHKDLKPYAATARFEDAEGNARRWRVSYPALGRELVLTFDRAFPHQVLSWEEVYSGLGGKKMSTRGELTHAILEDYWSHHRNADAGMRKTLGLSQ